MATLTEGSERRGLEGSLDRTRAELTDTLGELRVAMGQSLDWRAWVRKWPWAAVALAALVGARLGRGRGRGNVDVRGFGF